MEFETFTRLKEHHREKSKMSLEETGDMETEANELLRGNKVGVPTWVRVQNRVQNQVQNHVQNRVDKIKNIANEKISFLKITHPKKRYFIVS